MIWELRHEFAIKLLLEISGLARSTYYYYIKHRNDEDKYSEIKEQIKRIKDLIAYRIVISLPKCHLGPSEDREEIELKYLYEIANALPGFLEERGFAPEL